MAPRYVLFIKLVAGTWLGAWRKGKIIVILQNERQYEFTKAQLAKLEAAYQEADSHLAERDDVPDVIKSAQLNSMAFLISDLRAQLTDYEQLQGGYIKSLTLHSVLGELPETLVRARIARGWTHKQLAQALGTSPQQVQKDEAGGYAKASLEKLRRIADVLGISLSGRAKLPGPARSLNSKTSSPSP